MSEVRVVDPTTGGEKGQKLERTDLLPQDTLMSLARHYGRGARKYADRNWERGYAWSLSYGALLRHLLAWWGGEDIDEETGSSHIDAVMFHAHALRAFEMRGIGTDDRPQPKFHPTTFEEAWNEAVEAETERLTVGLLRTFECPPKQAFLVNEDWIYRDAFVDTTDEPSPWAECPDLKGRDL